MRRKVKWLVADLIADLMDRLAGTGESLLILCMGLLIAGLTGLWLVASGAPDWAVKGFSMTVMAVYGAVVLAKGRS